MLLDSYLEEHDINQVRAVVVDAEPPAVMDALKNTDLSRSGVFIKLLGWMKVMPERVAEFIHGRKELAVPDRFEVDELEEHGWMKLEESDDELVYGMVGRFWKPDPEILEDVDDFQGFDRPGFGKTAINFYLQPYGQGQTLLSYELRIDIMDTDGEKKFRRLWKIIGPFKGYLVGSVLKKVKEEAEKG